MAGCLDPRRVVRDEVLLERRALGKEEAVAYLVFSSSNGLSHGASLTNNYGRKSPREARRREEHTAAHSPSTASEC